MKMEQTECSETSTCKIQMPGNYPEESIQYSEHGESLKSRLHESFLSVVLAVATVASLYDHLNATLDIAHFHAFLSLVLMWL